MPGTKPEHFGFVFTNMLILFHNCSFCRLLTSKILGSVIKPNAEFFNMASVGGTVWRLITIFED